MAKHFEPLFDLLLVKEEKKIDHDKTDTGLIKIEKSPIRKGAVYAIGQGKYAPDTGTFMPTWLAKGDKIIFAPADYQEIDSDEEKGLLLMREHNVLLKISEKNS